MSLVKYNGGIPTEFLNLFDAFRDDFWKSPEIQFSRNWKPTDINENEKEYNIEIELPRFKKEQIKVEITKGVLKVVAKNDKSSYIREFSLPFVELDKTDVKLEDGVLKIVIPKSENGKTKYIDIK
jgi:HSP20 family protein